MSIFYKRNGKASTRTNYTLLLLFRPDRLCTLFLYLLSHYFYTHKKGFIYLLNSARPTTLPPSHKASEDKLRKGILLKSSMAAPYEALAKYGGERGIRTLDASFETYMISNHAPSTAQTPLLDTSSGALCEGGTGDLFFVYYFKKLFLCIKLLQCYFNITWAFFFNKDRFFSTFFST